MTTPTDEFKRAVESALTTLGEELINYDQRMVEAKAPNIRFTYKYNKKALASIQASTVKMLEGLKETLNADEQIDDLSLAEAVDVIDQLIKGFKMSAHKHQWQLDRIYYDTLAGPYLSSPPKHADFVCECGAYKRQLIKDLSNE